MNTRKAASELAVNHGTPVRVAPMPPRRLFGGEERAAVMRLFDRAVETGNAFGYNGEEEQAFDREFAAWMGGGFADGVNSGTSAVFVALGALQLEAVITDRTRAVVVAHIAGIPADMDGIMRVAEAHNLLVVEDCAQAHGARINSKLVGTFGDVAAFSTMSGKHMATAAQGGVVFTRDEDLYWRVKRFSDRGKPFNLEGETNVVPSLNLNLNELAAAVGRVQLKKLPCGPWIITSTCKFTKDLMNRRLKTQSRHW